MPFWVYILQSEASGTLYVGQTSDLEQRIIRHNSDEPGSKRYTHRQKGPWVLLHSERYATRSEAMRREKFLKSGQGREWVKQAMLDGQLNRQSPPPAD